jgi:hypothetical protein
MFQNQARLEHHNPFLRDRNLGTRPRISPKASPPDFHLKNAEIPELNRFAAFQAFKNDIQRFLNDFFDINLGEIRLIGNFDHDIFLCHAPHLPLEFVLDGVSQPAPFYPVLQSGFSRQSQKQAKIIQPIGMIEDT